MARKSRKTLDNVAYDKAISPGCYRGGAYLRLSSDDTKKRGDSLDTQRNIIENYVATVPDICIVETYTDNNTTGTNFERPGFKKMMADVESGRINCILVKDLSRFGRNAIDAGYYIEKYLPALGARFVAITDSFDSNEGDGGILLPLKNMISESYALDISRKCRAVQRENIREGLFVGRMAPYGFAKSPKDCHRLVIDEEAATTVRQIFEWAAAGMGTGEIIRMLNEKCILPPSRYKWEKGLINNEKLLGKPFWQKRVVADILRDRVYVGDMVQGKTRTVNGKELSVPHEEWVCVANTHTPVISCEQFEIVQDLLRKTSKKDKAVRCMAIPYSPHVLKGKVFCAHCGHPMHRHRQNKDGIYWYRCESQWKIHTDACFQVSVKEAELKVEIVTLLHKYAEVILGRLAVAEQNRTQPAFDAELTNIKRKLAESSRFQKSLYENLVRELITAEDFSELKADYDTKIKSFSERADEIRRLQREQAEALHLYRDMADALHATLSDAELSTDAIDCLVEKILVHRDKNFEIKFRFADEFKEVQLVG